MTSSLCDYCVLHDMGASELFVGKGGVCASCGTKLSGGKAVATTPASPPSRSRPRKAEIDLWSASPPDNKEIRDAWEGAAAAVDSDDLEKALELLSKAIKLGCKEDDGAVMGDEDAEKCAAEVEAAVLCAEDQARLYANRASVYLGTDKRMQAANDGRVATEMCHEWWRGHWMKGQALLLGLEGKKPSSFNAGKAEAAGAALQAALRSGSLPTSKRVEVEAQAEEAKGLLVALNPACAQM
mmetsp:Transcript_28986/g.58273  ORF Transcript_28986/g.58273 Transcript_28986/m.58273 type:complete len:240 (+) Transcript_28986:1-720(+)